jgi:glycosyltransferase involved in cell wall biosynthesis
LTNQPFISVVIPVWNSPDLLAKCLAALAVQSYPRERYEVLVVDNGSTDSTAAVARNYPFVTLLSEPVPGAYRARNRGLAAARGEYVAFTDADCIPDPEWLAAGARTGRRNPAAGVLAGQVDLFRDGSVGSAACEKYEYAFEFDQAKNVRHGVCVTANWMSPRATLLQFRGFDESLKSGGDWHLCGRIHAAGYPIIYAPEMRVRHPVRASLSQLAAKRRRVIGGRWQSTQRRWRFLWCSAVVVKRTTRRIIGTASDRRFSLLDRARIIGVVVALSAIGIVELIRLAWGGEATRA